MKGPYNLGNAMYKRTFEPRKAYRSCVCCTYICLRFKKFQDNIQYETRIILLWRVQNAEKFVNILNSCNHLLELLYKSIMLR